MTKRNAAPVLGLLLAALSALPSAADDQTPDLGATVDCIGAGTAPTACLAQAMASCHAAPPDTPAIASQCFRAAQEGFAAAIAGRMAALRETGPENRAAVESIEAKYDLLLGLTQCERMAELALLGDAEGPEIQRLKDGCVATATGLAWLRLQARAGVP